MRQRHLRQILLGLAFLVCAWALGGCGFELRRPPEFAFSSVYASVAPSSVLGIELKRNLAAVGSVKLITDTAQAKNAQVVLEVVNELREKVVVGMNASGQVREFQLRLRLKFRLRTQDGTELIQETELLQQRDLSYSEVYALSKEAEEAMLYRSMQTDIVHQIIRRMAAIKTLSTAD